MKPIDNQLPRACVACGGSGWETKNCPSCGGMGSKMVFRSRPVFRNGKYVNETHYERETCSSCGGSGHRKMLCPMCHGSGQIR